MGIDTGRVWRGCDRSIMENGVGEQGLAWQELFVHGDSPLISAVLCALQNRDCVGLSLSLVLTKKRIEGMSFFLKMF